MPPADGPHDTDENGFREVAIVRQTLELQLFDSLVHHLIEKGVLTRNDALSVVQTVAEVEKGALEEQPGLNTDNLAKLERLYASYQTLPERQPSHPPEDEDGNVVQLRPPIHGGQPRFPEDN